MSVGRMLATSPRTWGAAWAPGLARSSPPVIRARLVARLIPTIMAPTFLALKAYAIFTEIYFNPKQLHGVLNVFLASAAACPEVPVGQGHEVGMVDLQAAAKIEAGFGRHRDLAIRIDALGILDADGSQGPAGRGEGDGLVPQAIAAGGGLRLVLRQKIDHQAGYPGGI